MPERHRAALHPRAVRPSQLTAAVAASALLMLGAAGGWLAARASFTATGGEGAFLDATLAAATARTADAPSQLLRAAGPGTPGPSGLALSLPAPDLSILALRLPDLGESVVAKGWRFEAVDLDGCRIDKVPVSKAGCRRQRGAPASAFFAAQRRVADAAPTGPS